MGWQPRHLRRGTHANDDFPYFLEQYRGGRQRWPSGPAVAVAGFFALVTSLLMFKRVAAVFRGQGGKRPWHTLALALAPVLTAWAASTGVLHVRSFLYADGVAAVCEAAALRAHAGLALPDDAWAAADGDVCRRAYDVVATTLVALRTMVSCEPRETTRGCCNPNSRSAPMVKRTATRPRFTSPGFRSLPEARLAHRTSWEAKPS